MNFNKVTSESLKSDWHSFINEGGMRLILPMAFHVVIWIKIGWSTLYPHLFKAYAISVFLGFAIALLKRKMKNHIYVISLSLAPLIVSLMLIVNYSFSSNPYDETFSYVAPTNQRINSFDQDRFIMTPRIILKDYAYGEYQGMRSFLSKEEFKGNKITYSFEIGLFGIPVVKDWEFHK